MKRAFILLLVVAFARTALADKADDYWQFEKWLQYVHQEAPRYGLKLHWGDKFEADWFYLYYWQNNNHSIGQACKQTKELWSTKRTSNIWLCSYVCYVHGEAASIGCAILEATSASEARRQFYKANFGETCRITGVEKAK